MHVVKRHTYVGQAGRAVFEVVHLAVHGADAVDASCSVITVSGTIGGYNVSEKHRAKGTKIRRKLIIQLGGVNYYAMVPADGEESDDDFLEYTILKGVIEDGEETLVSIDDDDEFEDIAAYFDDLLSEEIDYDPPKK